MTNYRGLTWRHPRGTEALRHAAAEFSAQSHGDTLSWDSQPLEGFESHPVSELCAAYDLVVLDHPHLGDALADRAVQPLSRFFDAGRLAEFSAAAVGASAESYGRDGELWALPLDAATQVAAANRARVPCPPRTWTQVEELADEVPVALCLAGPHALLSFFSLCVALGEAPGTTADGDLVSRQVGEAALEWMFRIVQRGPAHTHELNPIALLELLAGGEELAYCPLIYGYVNYAAARDGAPVRFADVPVATPGGPLGSTLGGTGLAVSSRRRPSTALLAHLDHLMSASVQRDVIPAHQGQPGRREAWLDAGLNDAYGGFYRDTLASTERAWVRPRYPGYTRFQSAGSAALRQALTGGGTPATAFTELVELRRRMARER